MKRLVASDAIRELVRSLPPDLKRKIRFALDHILSDPLSGKALVKELYGLRSYRVDRIRIIYKVWERQVHLIAIGPRKTIYQEVALELKRQMREPSP